MNLILNNNKKNINTLLESNIKSLNKFPLNKSSGITSRSIKPKTAIGILKKVYEPI